MEPIDDLTVVIRSSNERTEQLCKFLIKEQGVQEKNIFIVRESPFSKAMKMGYQIGLDQNLTWTYVFDADVLLHRESIKNMLNAAQEMPNNLIGISGRLLDKLMGMKRTAGNYLFSTKILSRMIGEIKPYEKENIRPESTIIRKLQHQGYVYKKVNQFIGLHDFEQHYHDIARKAFTHAQKHTAYLGELVTYWKHASKNDRDFEVALFGLSKGIVHNEAVKINIDNFIGLYEEVANEFGSLDDDVTNFKIHNFNDVESAMKNQNNYFHSNERLENYLDKKLQKRLQNLTNKELAKRLLVNLKNKIL